MSKTTAYNVIAAVGEVSTYINVLLSTVCAALLTYIAVTYAVQPSPEDVGQVIQSKVIKVVEGCHQEPSFTCTVDVEFEYQGILYSATIPSMKRPREGDVLDVVLLPEKNKVLSPDQKIPVKEYWNYGDLSSMAIVSALTLCLIGAVLLRVVAESKPFAAGAGILTFLQAAAAIL